MIQLAGWVAARDSNASAASRRTPSQFLFTAIYFFFFLKKREKLNWMLPTAPRPKI
jgi:hypothetical protein